MLRHLSWGLFWGLIGSTACSGDGAKNDTTDTQSPATGDDAGGGGGGGGSSVSGDPTQTEVGDATVTLDEGEPIDAPDLTWVYVETPGSLCRDGKTTGFGVSINPASSKLVIYMEGGGACFNDLTCQGNPTSWGQADLGAGPGTPLLARDETNPMADWNMVYIPYCSGDVHSGTNPSGYNGQPQTGYINFTLALERIVPTFKQGLEMVVLTGSSAGGFGTAWNWMRTQDAFGDVVVHAFDDSGQPLGPDFLTPCLQQHTGKLWGWAVHPACVACDQAAGSVVQPLMDTALQRRKPGTRFALLSNDEDGVIKSFFAYGLEDCQYVTAGLLESATVLLNGYPQGKFPEGLDQLRTRLGVFDDVALYELSGGGHPIFLTANNWSTEVSGVTILDWTKQFLAGDEAWGNVQP